ncbi:12367_t:CDS:2 [Gigaspora margarita]|uniref:12367_t:CDS:1 n=1 Tax=Gigaspora margarita TaxID=4874 RepID=A0ABM8W6Z5_GIGMA|nr:12367_t:CDS:2 [Gigaspora margarita]
MDFYKHKAVEDWTCEKLIEFYHTTSEQKDQKKVLDSIKKDLKKIKEANSEFDAMQMFPPMNNLQQESIVNTGLTTSDELNTEKLGVAKTFGISFDKYIGLGMNIQDKSEVTEPSEDLEDENDEEVKFDLNDILGELQRELAVKWEVDNINVTDRFWNYQKNILRKAEQEEWAEIIKSNLYTIENSPLSKEVLTSFHEAACNNFIGKDVFMNGEKTKLSRDIACSFNDLTKLVVEKALLLLAEFAISHVIALEECVGKLAKDYKY